MRTSARPEDHDPAPAVSASEGCDLCGLPLRTGTIEARIGGRSLRFCCTGCRMVYGMLMEASETPDPALFAQSDLFRRCRDAGVIPGGPAGRPAPQPADAGIQRRLLSIGWGVRGMWCPACAWVIEAALAKTGGVESVVCDFAADRLQCRYDPVRTSPKEMEEAVARLGYRLLSPGGGEGGSGLRESARLAVSALLSVNIMMLSWALYAGFLGSLKIEGPGFIGWPAAVMAAMVMIAGGGPLTRKAWAGMRAGAPGMESLVLLASSCAYGYSLFNLLRGSWHLYFDSAAMLMTILLLGKRLEDGARRQVRADLEGFLALSPKKVRLCTAAFPEGRFTAAETLKKGDLYRLLPGETAPADGRVRRGDGRLDAAAVTGESKPVPVGPGEPVTSGSRLIDGDVIVETLRVGDESLLGQMIAAVGQGLSQRTAGETRGERWLRIFVPGVISLSVVTGLALLMLGRPAHQAVVRSITVLVIACPCALGLAIPLARVAGIAGAGRRGLLVRDFNAFEQVESLDTIVFDKTGTVTEGCWSMQQIDCAGGFSQDRAVALAAGLEQGADHPVGRAILSYAGANGIAAAPVADIRRQARGVSGRLNASRLWIGEATGGDGDRASGMDKNRGFDLLSEVHLSIDGRAAATLRFGDRLRPGMPALMERLRSRGMGLHLVSGDSRRVTRAAAAALGIGRSAGRLTPQDKHAYVQELRQAGRRVLMVGDGINDAPALAASDLAMAVHTGAPLARQAAAVTLMRGDPSQLLDFMDWARRVRRTVRGNLWCACVYNLISIPAAMSGLLNPLVAAAAMLLSSLTVIGNTLLLVRRGRSDRGFSS